MAFCRNCGKEVKEDAKFCKNCGAATGIATVPLCPKCGTKIKDDAAFCEGCGTSIRAAASVPVVRAVVSAPVITSNINLDDVELDEEPSVENLNLLGYFWKCLRYYAVFDGRARRKEFWGFYVGLFLYFIPLCFVVGLIMVAGGADAYEINSVMSVINIVYQLVILIPCMAVYVRRLHDVGKSGLNLLWCFTIIGAIPVFIWVAFCDSAPSNQYGPNPKGVPNFDDDL